MSRGTNMKVSVIIPAYNAERTLNEPLESLFAQTHTEWEAVIVDDGSSDGTLALARDYAQRDSRVRVMTQENAGVSVARNAGIAAARHDWLLFLDSDDTVAPEYLEFMTGALERDDSLDAVRCGWSSMTPRGYLTSKSIPKKEGDLFEELAVDWLFAIHACVVKKSLVEEVGGFEPGLAASEDWDLWQRVARTGARFGRVTEVLAFYRMRPGSASKQAYRMLVDAVRVLEQGHAPDPRVPRPHPVHPEGYVRDEKLIAYQKLYYACFSAGLCIGVGADPEPMLDEIPGVVLPDLDPYCVADWISSAALDATGRPLVEWPETWHEMVPEVERFLMALEAHAEAPGLAAETQALFSALIRLKMVSLGSVHRLRAVPAWAWIQLKTLRGEFEPKARKSAKMLLMWATQALRTMPGLYQRYRGWRRQYEMPEGREQLEELFERQADPWGYTNDYEQTKYSQTLELIPEGADDVLEIACAVGHFTTQLAPRAKRLVAVDISSKALSRAAERCSEHGNVRYEQFELGKDPVPGKFDVIVCSEVLYYLGRRSKLEAVARELAKGLKPGGRLVMAHANLTADDPESPGYDWGYNFGAKVIGETFAATPELSFSRAIQTPYYRVQCFERSEAAVEPQSSPQITWSQASTPPHEVDRHMVWDGIADSLRVLAYHRVAESGSKALAPYRVTPEAFEEQLRYLRDHGFTGITLQDWNHHVVHGGSVPKGAVLITFDDGYRDFKEHAWPLLERYGFSATVFLVADQIGGTNVWDAEHGESVPLLNWREIRELQAAGVTFGSHTASHAWLPDLSWRGVVRELKRSKQILEQGLGTEVPSLAYPWGAFDKPIQFLTGACGYEFGLSTAEGVATASHSLLALPRLDIAGSDTLDDFAAKLAPSTSEQEHIAAGSPVREPIFT